MKDKNGFELDPNLLPQENVAAKVSEGSTGQTLTQSHVDDRFLDKGEPGYANFSHPKVSEGSAGPTPTQSHVDDRFQDKVEAGYANFSYPPPKPQSSS